MVESCGNRARSSTSAADDAPNRLRSSFRGVSLRGSVTAQTYGRQRRRWPAVAEGIFTGASGPAGPTGRRAGPVRSAHTAGATRRGPDRPRTDAVRTHTRTQTDGHAFSNRVGSSRVYRPSTARLMRLDRLKHSTLPTRCLCTADSSSSLSYYYYYLNISRLPERHKPIELATIKQQNSRKKSVITKNTKRKRNYKYKKALGGDANTTRCGAWQTP